MLDEPIIFDTDPYITPGRALGALGLAFVGIGAFYGFLTIIDPSQSNPAVPREFPFNGLHVELGGDPDVVPATASADAADE